MRLLAKSKPVYVRQSIIGGIPLAETRVGNVYQYLALPEDRIMSKDEVDGEKNL